MDHANQHWIPKKYLAAWCDPTKRGNVVHRYGANGLYRDYRPPSRLFSEHELYTRPASDGGRDMRTELGLQKIEDGFYRVRRRLERGQMLDADYVTTIALFTATMRNRSPSARDHWQDFMDRIVALGDEMEEGLRTAPPDKLRRMKESRMLGGGGKSMSLQEARDAASEPFGAWLPRHMAIEAAYLAGMNLVILQAPTGVGFLTSDNPVVWWDTRHPTGRTNYPLGLSNQAIEVTAPLSPRFCAVFSHFGKNGLAQPSQEAVDMVNTRTLAHCDDCFIANSAELTVDWFQHN